MKGNKKIIIFFSRLAALISVFVISVFCGFTYITPTSYVSFHVNPTIEYTLNAFNRVLSVAYVNENGDDIYYDLDIKNYNISEAILETIDKLIEDSIISYNNEGKDFVIKVTNINNKNKADKLLKKLQIETQIYLDGKN